MGCLGALGVGVCCEWVSLVYSLVCLDVGKGAVVFAYAVFDCRVFAVPLSEAFVEDVVALDFGGDGGSVYGLEGCADVE